MAGPDKPAPIEVAVEHPSRVAASSLLAVTGRPNGVGLRAVGRVEDSEEPALIPWRESGTQMRRRMGRNEDEMEGWDGD